ncbi:hypothetical protein Mapa_012821 [Marchantia paleacea]|nr:hypothetical protein Mapa_012821 [Marchantia paleacea]
MRHNHFMVSCIYERLADSIPTMWQVFSAVGFCNFTMIYSSQFPTQFLSVNASKKSTRLS